MSNRNGLFVVLSLAAIGVAAAWLYFQSPRSTPAETGTPPASISSAVPLPVPGPSDDRPPAPPPAPTPTWIDGQSVDTLLAALRKACEVGDFEAQHGFRGILSQRPSEEVVDPAKHELASLRAGALRLAAAGAASTYDRHLVYLIAPTDLAFTLAALREPWSGDSPEAKGNLEKWTEYDRRPEYLAASACLNPATRELAGSVAAVLIDAWQDNDKRATPVTGQLLRILAAGPVSDEVMDPWLSEWVTRIAAARDKFSDATWSHPRRVLVALMDANYPSRRLRVQIEPMLVSSPGSFWGLMDAICQSTSTDALGAALAGFLANMRLDAEQTAMLVASIAEKLRGKPGEYQRLLAAVVRDFKSPVTPQRWADFATGLRDFALHAESNEEVIAACEMMDGLRSSWRAANKQWESLEAYPIFKGSDALQRLLECQRRYQAAETRPRMRDLPRARAIDLIWYCEGSIDDKLAAWQSLLKDADQDLSSSLGASLNALKYLALLWKNRAPTAAQAEVLASLVSATIEGCPTAFELKRPLVYMSLSVISLPWLSQALTAAGNPPLSKVAASRIYAFAVAVEEDSGGWKAKEAPDSIKAAADLKAAYGPK